MRPQGSTFWLLDGRIGWRTDRRSEGVAVGYTLLLAANPDGPLALASLGDDLGGLVLPRGLALDEQYTLYLLGQDKAQSYPVYEQCKDGVSPTGEEPWIKRFDPEQKKFVRLPAVGGEGSDARQMRRPRNVALAAGNLYVADSGNNRVQVFDSASLALRHIWSAQDAGDNPPAKAAAPWEPYDVAAGARVMYVLDRRYGRVFSHQPGSDMLRLLIHEPGAAGRWHRIAVDRDGRIYLLHWSQVGENGQSVRLDIYSPEGSRLDSVDDPGDVRERFEPPAIRLSQDPRDPQKFRFCLPATLLHLCDRRPPAKPPTPELSLGGCPPWSEGGLLFDRQGCPVGYVDPAEPLGPRLYQKSGTWISEALDSQIHRCQWHRIELEMAELPPGTRVTVSTFIDEAGRRPYEVSSEQWDTNFTITGEMQRSPRPSNSPGRQSRRPTEFLVQSQEGRFLRLRLKLEGDGYATPLVQSIRVHYPRESYLNYLPAVYSADEESRRFLERFLSIFQTEWDRLEQEIDDVARYFDPNAVPPGPMLAYLAQWLALPLEGLWDEQQKRRLLSAAPHFYSRRGTAGSLQRYLSVYLHNISGVESQGQDDYPRIVEGFRERQFFQLALQNQARLGGGAPLWGPAIVGRLQLDVFAREGEVRLVSTGDPERDLFHEYAHRFRVFVPSAWIRTAEDERMLCRALDAEKPAHTRYDLCLVEPRLRVGLQSTIGLDTIVGAYPVAHLACPHAADAPPSRAPRHRLGYDTVLGGIPAGGPGVRLGPGTRVGIDTTIT